MFLKRAILKKTIRFPKDAMSSVSVQSAEKADAAADLTASKRHLHDYVAEYRSGLMFELGFHCLWEPMHVARVNLAFFSLLAGRVRLELFDYSDDAMIASDGMFLPD